MQDHVSHLISFVLLLFCSGAFASLILWKYFCRQQEGHQRRIIYGFSLFLCGLCSYLYTTGFPGIPSPLLKQFDHAAIFLLIAGTYTPFSSHLIFGPLRIRLIYWIWGLAISGVLLRLFFAAAYDKAFLAMYLATGWMFLTALPDIIRQIPRSSLIFLGLGAVVYSSGAVIFAIDIGTWTVSVWHVFVLVAAVLHYLAVIKLIARRPNEMPSVAS